MSAYYLTIIPGTLWFGATMLQADRLCSRITANLFLLASLLCFGAGFALNSRGFFPEKGGLIVVVFSVPLIFTGITEIFRLIYVAVRHETPCINYRSGRWLGDRPRDGFFTKYPESKVISWPDVLFGISQWIIPIILVIILFICSLAMNW